MRTIMRLRTFRTLVSFLGFVLVCTATFAHGDKKHIVGTVEKVNPGSIVVKAKDGNSVMVKLAASTVYVLREAKTDKPAKASDLAVGDLVVIHASPKDTGLEADEVRFSVPAARNAAASPSKP